MNTKKTGAKYRFKKVYIVKKKNFRDGEKTIYAYKIQKDARNVAKHLENAARKEEGNYDRYTYETVKLFYERQDEFKRLFGDEEE